MTEAYYYLSFLLIFPFAAICYLPLRRHMKHPLSVTAAFVVGVYAVLCLFYKPILGALGGHIGLLMPIVLIILYIAYIQNFKADIIRASLVYAWGLALITFASVLTRTYVLFRSVYENGTEVSLVTQLIRFFFAVLIVVLACLFTLRWKQDFIVSDAVPTLFWIMWIPIPLLFLAMEIGLMSYIQVFGGFSGGIALYLLFLFGLIFIYVFLTEIFYTVNDSFITAAKLLEEQRFLDVQRVQYKRLQEEMDAGKRIRHDFRHSFNSLKALIEKEDMEGLKSFIENFDETGLNRTVLNYCDNPAINAILNHYAYEARAAGIDLVLQVNLPAELTVGDPELASLIGNLMENAIDACKKLPENERKYSFSILVKGSSLYVVSTNTYGGEILKDGERFMSTKHDGAGIGTRSITETVKKHKGNVRFHHNEKEFMVDIVMEV